MDAQWEIVNTFEDILSEMARSLEELLPVEADIPKLDRQRTSLNMSHNGQGGHAWVIVVEEEVTAKFC